jgi:hypothetical protein
MAEPRKYVDACSDRLKDMLESPRNGVRLRGLSAWTLNTRRCCLFLGGIDRRRCQHLRLEFLRHGLSLRVR